MFKHILVPLDGSGLAESALPAAAALATALDARVTLIHIIEAGASPSIHGERHLTDTVEAQDYLEEIGRRAFPSGFGFDCHVHTAAMKDVAGGIVLHEGELAPDLVVMCTHGRGGLRQMLFGRIAQQVAASGTIPVLLVRPRETERARPFACRLILAPMDGTSLHAKGLAMAADLARTLPARLELLTVIPTVGKLTGRQVTTSRFAPGTTQAMLELETVQLQEDLAGQAARFVSLGIPTGTRVARGEPAATIAAVADELDADLIAIGTHGKIGAEAFWTQSIGARLLARTVRPVLLVPV
ncbi:MAG: universal stress protein [Deltaproteobacteria bacterium]|nr:universal stress protein [Deltaproteobacteria bacterium]